MRKRKDTETIIGVVLHHTDTPESKTVDDITAIHKNKGYETVGYHRLIKRVGDKAFTKEGRNLIFVGGHTIMSETEAKKDKEAKGNIGYYNQRWMGVALIGDYDKNKIDPSYYMAVIYALADILKKYNLKRLRGHKECKATACPGRYIDLDKVRKDLTKILGYEITK